MPAPQISNDTGSSALIVGASGQVGYHLALAAKRRGIDWTGTFHSQSRPGLQHLDVREASAVAEMVRALRPACIVAPAAAAQVDRCEREPQIAYPVNVSGMGHLIDAANEVGATLVHFSSDYIFDGREGPYDESAAANPLSQYGLQKLAAEHLVMQRAREALIVRTTVVYGEEPQEKNFIYRLLGGLCEGREVAVPSDQLGTPTYAPALADAVFDLLALGARGVVNLAGEDLIARDEFAREAARAFGEDPELVRSVPTRELHQAAPRPLRAGLRSEHAARLLGWTLPGYVEGLRQMSCASPAAA